MANNKAQRVLEQQKLNEQFKKENPDLHYDDVTKEFFDFCKENEIDGLTTVIRMMFNQMNFVNHGVSTRNPKIEEQDGTDD